MAKGLSPRIRVAAPTGATITGTLGGDTVSFTEKSTGVYEADVEKLGPWRVSGTLGQKTGSTVVSVDDVGLFEGAEMSFISTTLNDNDWATISEVSQAGTGANYWSIGDAKEIALNGTIGTKAFDNVTLCVFILDFNHPENGVADNNIIWGGFKTALTNGVDVCLDDDAYNTDPTSGQKKFNMNHTYVISASDSTAGYYGTNYGGWKGTDLRYDILGAVETQPSMYNQLKTSSNVGYDATETAITSPIANTLMAALPAAFRNVLRLWTRWVDNKGNKSNVDANVTACIDAGISLLTEFEVFGTRSYANNYEQNHQVQCAYYVNGNSKVKYRQSSTGTSASWWESSVCSGNTNAFCWIYSAGSANFNNACRAYALAPAFKT